MKFWDPKRYGQVGVGPLSMRPSIDAVPDESVWIATDTYEVYAARDGSWIKVADLTAGIDWESILNKPDAFPPEIHDLDSAHSGTLPIERVAGHDFYARGHRKLAALGQLNEPF